MHPRTRLPVLTRRCSLVALLLSSWLGCLDAHAAYVAPFGPLPGGNVGLAYGISADGSTVVGITDDGAFGYAAYWVNGTLTALPDLGGNTNIAQAVNADGSVIVGYMDSPSTNIQAVRWDNGALTVLGTLLNGNYSAATDVSADGSIVVGYSDTPSTVFYATYWDSNNVATALAGLSASGNSLAIGISGDASTIVGYSFGNDFNYHATSWSGGGYSLTPLTELAGATTSFAYAVNNDGSVIVGISDSATSGGNVHAVRWDNGVVSELGILSGGFYSTAVAVTGDGSIVAGLAEQGGYEHAVLWDGNGVTKISDVLIGQGVNMAGWNLSKANGISDNGMIIVGEGTNNGANTGFIANLGAGGLSTPQAVRDSLQTGETSGQQGNALAVSQMDQSLFLAINTFIPQSVSVPPDSSAQSFANMSPASGGRLSSWEVFGTVGLNTGQGNDESNHDFNGMIGLKKMITPDLAMGFGVLGSSAENDTQFNGRTSMSAFGGSALAAYAPSSSGLRLYGSLFAANLSFDIDRNYMNGGSVDTSRASPDGFAYGAAAQAGWAFTMTPKSVVTPYVEYRWSQSKVDAYTETGGGFASSFSRQKLDNQSVRLGLRNNYQIRPDVSVTSRVAYAHRLSNDGGGFSTNTGGFNQSFGVDPGDRGFVEAGVGAVIQATPTTHFAFEVNGRTGDSSEPRMGVMLSAGIKF